MNVVTKTLLWTTSIAVVIAAVAAPAVLRADDDGDDEHEAHERHSGRPARGGEGRGERRGDGGGAAQATQVPDPRSTPGFAEYAAECGACHLAYPPGLLPARSWVKLLDGLADHFGQNAELDAEARGRLGAWLEVNAAESRSHALSKKVLKSAGAGVPLRISALGFIQHEHDEVAGDVWSRPAVKTVANCGACHTTADEWMFDEDQVKIPR